MASTSSPHDQYCSRGMSFFSNARGTVPQGLWRSFLVSISGGEAGSQGVWMRTFFGFSNRSNRIVQAAMQEITGEGWTLSWKKSLRKHEDGLEPFSSLP